MNKVHQIFELWTNNQIPTSGAATAVKKIRCCLNQWLETQKKFFCKIFRQRLNWLQCRRHIFDNIFKSAFEVYWPVLSGPNVLISRRFKKLWDNIDKTKYKSGEENTVAADIVSNKK